MSNQYEETEEGIPVWYKNFIAAETERDAKLSAILLDIIKPTNLHTWCRYWVPQMTGIQPDKMGYQLACIEVISLLTGYQKYSIKDWFKGKNHLPMLGHTLKLLHIIFLLIRAYKILSKRSGENEKY
jgi:hypothetical protein